MIKILGLSHLCNDKINNKTRLRQIQLVLMQNVNRVKTIILMKNNINTNLYVIWITKTNKKVKKIFYIYLENIVPVFQMFKNVL